MKHFLEYLAESMSLEEVDKLADAFTVGFNTVMNNDLAKKSSYYDETTMNISLGKEGEEWSFELANDLNELRISRTTYNGEKTTNFTKVVTLETPFTIENLEEILVRIKKAVAG